VVLGINAYRGFCTKSRYRLKQSEPLANGSLGPTQSQRLNAHYQLANLVEYFRALRQEWSALISQ
jgi:hypothetical protein